MILSITALFLTALSVFSNVLAAPLSLAVQTHSGQATFYAPGLGACGHTNVASDFIVAVGIATFNSFPGAGANPNTNPICAKTITATDPVTQRSVTVNVVDSCPSCGPNDLDLSPAAFNVLAGSLAPGRVPVNWNFN